MLSLILTTLIHVSTTNCDLAKLRETDAKNKCEAAKKTKDPSQEETCKEADRATLARKTVCK